MCIQDAVTIFPGTVEPPTSQYYAYRKVTEDNYADRPSNQASSAPPKADRSGAWWTGSSPPSRIYSSASVAESSGGAHPGSGLLPHRRPSIPTEQHRVLSAPTLSGAFSPKKTGLASTTAKTTIPTAKPIPVTPAGRNLNQIVTYSCKPPIK